MTCRARPVVHAQFKGTVHTANAGFGPISLCSLSKSVTFMKNGMECDPPSQDDAEIISWLVYPTSPLSSRGGIGDVSESFSAPLAVRIVPGRWRNLSDKSIFFLGPVIAPSH